MNYLEVVEQGGVIKSVTGNQNRLEQEFTLPVRNSTWIAARAATAATPRRCT